MLRETLAELHRALPTKTNIMSSDGRDLAGNEAIRKDIGELKQAGFMPGMNVEGR